MTVFAPTGPDGRALWLPVYDHVRRLDYDTTVKDADLEQIAGRPLRPGGYPYPRVVAELERRDQRTLVRVRLVGYRIARPDEHVAVVRGRERRAHRQYQRALSTGHATPKHLLDADGRGLLDATLLRVAELEQATRHHGRALVRHDKAIAATQEDVAALRRQVVALAEALTASTPAEG